MFWPMDPSPDDVSIEDIAHALSHLCRYGGHCREFYSVAQHSVLVSRALPRPLRLWGLLHDASEAYVVDVPRPLKRYLPQYNEAEAAVTRAIVQAFNLTPAECPPEVKQIDTAILSDEAAQLLGPPPRPWEDMLPPLGIEITPWGSLRAKAVFLQEFHSLTPTAQEAN